MAGATAFVLALALLFLSYAYVRHRHNQTLDDNHRALPSGLAHSEEFTDPVSLLGEAKRLYWLNNGPKAAPLFARAELLFADRGDARNELYARVGRLRSEAETMSFVELSRFIDEQLQNPIVRGDDKLRLWCLIAKGYTDIEIDYRAAKRDWLEAQGIAKNLGDDRAVTRNPTAWATIAAVAGASPVTMTVRTPKVLSFEIREIESSRGGSLRAIRPISFRDAAGPAATAKLPRSMSCARTKPER